MIAPELASPRWTPPIHMDEPLWLLLLVLLIPIAWTGLRSLSTMSPARRVSAVAARVSLLTLIVLALSGASVVGRSDRLAVVVAVDVSGSVLRGAPDGSEALGSIRSVIDRLDATRGPDDLLGVVLFDGRSVALATPTAGRLGERSWELAPSDGTNIEAALRLAGAIIPPGVDGRVLLATDGNQTAGDAIAAAADLGARSIPVEVVPFAPSDEGETLIERVETPTRAPSGARIAARVHMRSTRGSRGTLRILVDGQPAPIGPGGATSRIIEVEPGTSIHLAEFGLGGGRVHSIEASFEPEIDESGSMLGDSIRANNIGRAEVLTPGAGAILLVDGVGNADRGAAGAALVGPLARAGLDVRMVVPEALPTDLLGFEPYDLVILQSVPASAVPESTQRALVSYVRDLGGGLAMIGGRGSFGAGGWKGSELEPILPVLLDLPDRLMVPEAAIVFVLDCSGSMRRRVLGSSRTQQQVANEAAVIAIRSLDRSDLVGVVRFNESVDVVVPLGPNTDPDTSALRIFDIDADGGTDARGGILEAGRQLRSAKAKTKHLVLLSDGQSMGSDALPGMAAQLAQEGVTVTTIAVGDDADVATMSRMAELGGGAFHNVLNPSRLPRVFLKVVELVRSPMIREGRFSPRVLPTGSPLVQDLGHPPDLLGLVLTRARVDPLVTLAMVVGARVAGEGELGGGEPVLAHWPVGLGRVLAFTSDAHDWGSEWLDWDGYAPFWTRVARVIGRSSTGGPVELAARVEDGRVRLSMEASSPSGDSLDGLDARVTLYRRDVPEEPRELTLRQTGPGRYEGSLPASPGASYVALARVTQSVQDADGLEVQRALAPALAVTVAPPGAEYRPGPDPMPMLGRIAEVSGGSVRGESPIAASDAFDRSTLVPRRVLRPLWRSLLPWILAVLLMDIATRRIAWDRLVSDRFGDGIGKRARAATRERTQESARTLVALRASRSSAPTDVQRAESAVDPLEAQRASRQQASERHAARIAEARKRAGVDPLDGARRVETSPEVRGDGESSRAGSGEEASDGESGLMAAKRRARERIERERSGES